MYIGICVNHQMSTPLCQELLVLSEGKDVVLRHVKDRALARGFFTRDSDLGATDEFAFAPNR